MGLVGQGKGEGIIIPAAGKHSLGQQNSTIDWNKKPSTINHISDPI